MTGSDDTTPRQQLRERLRISPEDVEAVNASSAARQPPRGGLLDLSRATAAWRRSTAAPTRPGASKPPRAPRGRGLALPRRPAVAAPSSATPAPSSRCREYRRCVLGDRRRRHGASTRRNAVTLEISALQYFPWLIAEAEHAIAHRELMPGRYIRVRSMAEQSAPGEDILAVAAAMQIIGATHVETLDTKGIDGSNVHLGGPDTIAGYFGGIGQPNDYPLKWADEYLHYLTEYGVRQVLNVNSGTILVALLLHKLGMRNEFKVSVFMGVDNPWSVLWLLMGARLLAGRRRLDQHDRPQPLQLGRAADPAGRRRRAPGARPRGRRALRAPRHRGLQVHRAAALRPPRRRGARPRPPCRTSAPSTRAATPDVEAGREHPSDIFDYFHAAGGDRARAASCPCSRRTTWTSTPP